MAKISRKTLARGSTLPTEAVFDPMSAAATVLANAAVSADQLSSGTPSFRLNLNIPLIDSAYFRYGGNLSAWCLPFVLPPVQDEFSTTGKTSTSTSFHILDEVSISFDQRSEPATIIGNTDAVHAAGLLNYDNPDAYSINLTIVGKDQSYFNATSDLVARDELMSVDIPQESFSGRGFRFNPLVINDLNRQVKPYTTYVLQIKAPNLYATAFKSAIVSVQISMKFKSQLTYRDTTAVQNIPQHAGAKNKNSYTINTPASNTAIRSDGGLGIQTNLKKIDQALVDKLSGGYTQDSGVPRYEQLSDDAAYDVIAVPMWSNFGDVGYIAAKNVGTLPYVGVAPFVQATMDRRVIPIPYPMTIHHVVVMTNYSTDDGSATLTKGRHPSSATNIQKVGVGIVTGSRADFMQYQQVAYTEWTPNAGAKPKSAITIDKIKFSDWFRQSLDPTEDWDYEVLSVPLVNAAAPGSGYYIQGRPFFIGRASSRNQTRSNVGDAAGASVQPATDGLEQFIEVRWSIEDVNGLAPTTDATPGASNPDDIFMGNGGGWVYIIGKKHLSVGPDDLSL